MTNKPDFRAQFRDTPSQPREYMGGHSQSCGEHPSLPKRHRWSKPREYRRPDGSLMFRDRMCLTCALTESIE